MKIKRALCLTLAFFTIVALSVTTLTVSATSNKTILNDENNIKVSVIIPVYNVENYIRECMDSVVNQTLKDIEIICIDDGTPDNSGKIVDEYANVDSRVHVIHQENAGVSAARNRGIDVAKGEYIKFVDSDDVLALNACEICYNKAKLENTDILYHDLVDKTFDDQQFNRIHITIWLGLYKTKFIKDNNIRFNEVAPFGEDQAFNLLCNPKANKIVGIADKLYNYRVDNAGSITHVSKIAKQSRCLSQNANCVYNDWKKNRYFENNRAKVGFLKWFCDVNEWKDNYDIDKMFLNSIGEELLTDDTLNLLPQEYKNAIKGMIDIVKGGE